MSLYITGGEFGCQEEHDGQVYCVCPKDAAGHVLQPAVCAGSSACARLGSHNHGLNIMSSFSAMYT